MSQAKRMSQFIYELISRKKTDKSGFESVDVFPLITFCCWSGIINNVVIGNMSILSFIIIYRSISSVAQKEKVLIRSFSHPREEEVVKLFDLCLLREIIVITEKTFEKMYKYFRITWITFWFFALKQFISLIYRRC